MLAWQYPPIRDDLLHIFQECSSRGSKTQQRRAAAALSTVCGHEVTALCALLQSVFLGLGNSPARPSWIGMHIFAGIANVALQAAEIIDQPRRIPGKEENSP
jgi:hypothetical protein